MDLPTTISVDEASELLGVSRRTAYRAIERRQIPALKIGRRLLIPTRPLFGMLGLEPEDGLRLLQATRTAVT